MKNKLFDLFNKYIWGLQDVIDCLFIATRFNI